MPNSVTINSKIKKFKKIISVSGDKSLSIRWVLFSSLASGISKATNLLISDDVLAAIKTIRKNSRETLINKSRKSRFKNAIKKMNILIEKKNKKDALSYLPKLNSELMKIAKTGVIKKGNASRNLSRLTKKINSL